MRARISGWEKKYLAHGGRLTLIKSVLSSMPLHLLQVMSAPKNVIERIERLFLDFFGALQMIEGRFTGLGGKIIVFPWMKVVLVLDQLKIPLKLSQ